MRKLQSKEYYEAKIKKLVRQFYKRRTLQGRMRKAKRIAMCAKNIEVIKLRASAVCLP